MQLVGSIETAFRQSVGAQQKVIEVDESEPWIVEHLLVDIPLASAAIGQSGQRAREGVIAT